MESKNILKTEQVIKISWKKIQSEMKEKFGKDIYDSWLRKISLLHFTICHNKIHQRLDYLKIFRPNFNYC